MIKYLINVLFLYNKGFTLKKSIQLAKGLK
jgi:hypothetical protein